MVIVKVFFATDFGNWYWIVFGGLVFIILKLPLPYKNYKFKTERLRGDGSSLYLMGGIGQSYEVVASGTDQKKGLQLTFFKIPWDLKNYMDKEKIGDIYLLPSDFYSLMNRMSGKLDIVYVQGNTIKRTRYLEKIPNGSIGVMLNFAWQSENGIIAMVETVTKPYSIFSSMKGLKNDLV